MRACEACAHYDPLIFFQQNLRKKQVAKAPQKQVHFRIKFVIVNDLKVILNFKNADLSVKNSTFGNRKNTKSVGIKFVIFSIEKVIVGIENLDLSMLQRFLKRKPVTLHFVTCLRSAKEMAFAAQTRVKEKGV